MDLRSSIDSWAGAHAFFDQMLMRPRNDDVIPLLGHQWREHIAKDAPNSNLYLQNSVFSALQNDQKLYVIHVSHNTREIVQHGVIYPSGGCMVGAIYGTLAFKEAGGLRPHNLGRYIIDREAPMSLKNLAIYDHEVTPLIIELTLPSTAYRGLAGIDYLRLGNVHLQIFEQLGYLLSRSERQLLHDSVTRRIRNSSAFLNMCNVALHEKTQLDSEQFIQKLNVAIGMLPILGYMYFETVSEYLMLYSNSAQSKSFMLAGEFNNWLYKEMMFGMFPKMAGQFHLSDFRPSAKDLVDRARALDSTIDGSHMLKYVTDRMLYFVNARLFTSDMRPDIWPNIRWEFNDLKPTLAPLLGHLIHREMRTFGRYPDFYFYFDQYKALQAWNYWNQMDILVPFNGTFPKGEIGINPAYPDLDYKIYTARQTPKGLLEPVDELKVKIVPRLIDLRHTLMRNHQHSIQTPSTLPK
jgi:hypothetical protein